MRSRVLSGLLLLGACSPSAPTEDKIRSAAATPTAGPRDNARAEPAKGPTGDDLAHRFLVLDGHVDVPMRLMASRNAKGELTEDVSIATAQGDFDYPRAKKGGLDAPFISIYVPADLQKTGGSREYADELIDLVEKLAKDHPDKFALAKTTAEVQANFKAGKVSLPLGMENGSPIGEDLANLKHFHERGIRYITLAHSKDNAISDSSYDTKHTHEGLSKFGRELVPEMNRLGIMIDVSHISDDAFWQVMELSQTPVIASHSSCRHFIPGFQRNMSDEMIKKLADRKGVIQINFGSSFVSRVSHEAGKREREAGKRLAKARGVEFQGATKRQILAELRKQQPYPYATVKHVADHIMHVVKLVGIDYVGLGSDYDGVGDTLPRGLEDVSKYPALFDELLARGLSPADIEKIASGNVLRVWRAVEAHAAQSGQSGQRAN